MSIERDKDEGPEIQRGRGWKKPPTASAKASPPKLPWMQWKPGERVVVRYREEDGGLRDALGILLENAPDHVVIDTRRGRVRVEATSMVVGRLVLPPRPFGGAGKSASKSD